MSSAQRLALPAQVRRRPGVTLAAAALSVAALVASVTLGVRASAAGASVPRPAQRATEIARDSYHRTVQHGLGAAQRGGRYVVHAGSGVHLRVRSGEAQVTSLGRGRALRAELPAVSVANAFVSLTVRIPKGRWTTGGFFFGPELRVGASGSYRAKLRVAHGHVGLRLSRTGGGAHEVILAAQSLPLRVRAGNRLVIQAQVSGLRTPSLSVRVWAYGHRAPGWQLRYTDRSRQAIRRAGTLGAWAYESRLGRAVSFSFTDLRAWRLTTVGGSTRPAPGSGGSSTPKPTPTPTPGDPGPTDPTPPPGGGTPADRGAPALGSTTYPVPSDAVWVAPAGVDSASGSAADPLRTIAAAIAHAASGQTIVVRAGTYHESLQVPYGKAGLIIEPAPDAVVWLDGSTPVNGWTEGAGTTWVHGGWSAQFDHSASFTSGRDDGMVGSQNPMAAWADGVWLGGTELRQVGAESAVGPGTFYVDYAGQRLVLGSDPNGHEVRASDLAQAIKVSAPNVTLRGFGVRRYATALPMLGTVRLEAAGNLLRDMVVTDNATQGVSIRGAGNRLEHDTVTANGMTGVHANVADGLTIRDSVLDDNNAQAFNQAPSAAGVKVTRSRHLTIVNDSFDGNGATGLWFDQCDVDFTVANNSFQGDFIGVALELADTGIVANNVFRGGKYGLYVFDTGNVKVYNNSFADHPIGAVLMSQDQRRQDDPAAYQRDGDSRYPMGDATDPWLLRNVTVADNFFPSDGTDGMFQVYALDKRTNTPADAMHLTISGNYFRHRDSGSQPSMVGWGGPDNVTVTRYETPSALASAKDSSWRNGQAPAAGGRSFDSSMDDSIAVPLPSDVASAVGEPAGTRHVGPF